MPQTPQTPSCSPPPCIEGPCPGSLNPLPQTALHLHRACCPLAQHFPARGSPHSIALVSLPKEEFYPPPSKTCTATPRSAFLVQWDPRLLHPWILLEKNLFSDIYNPLEAPDSMALQPARMGHLLASRNPTGTREQTPVVLQHITGFLKNQRQHESSPDLLHPME